MADAFKYNYAIVNRIPNSFRDKSNRAGRLAGPNNLEAIHSEFKTYTDTLKKCSVQVIELPCDENYPDSGFIEDCAVVINGTALITRPGDPKRRGEVSQIRHQLRNEFSFKIAEIEDSSGTVDGGDVLFTGKEIFVGMTKNTNALGAQSVAKAFPEYTVSVIRIDGDRNLKYYVSMAGTNIMAVGMSMEAKKVMASIKSQATYTYTVMTLDIDSAANMLFVNGCLVHRSRDEIKEQSHSTLDEKIPYTKHATPLAALNKAGGTLSSLSLLVRKSKHPKKISSTLNDEDLSKYSMVKESVYE